MQAVLVAGGLGTRAQPYLGPDRPKILADIGGQPFLQVQLARLAALGATRVHLCLGFGAAMVMDALAALNRGSDGSLPMPTTSTIEDRPLGVIGALHHAVAHLEDRFVLVYGDVLPMAPFKSLVATSQTMRVPAVMAVCPATRCGNVMIRGGLVSMYEKSAVGNLLDAGQTLLSKELLQSHPQAVHEQELYRAMANDHALAAFRLHSAVHDIGDPASYAAFLRHVREGGGQCFGSSLAGDGVAGDIF